MNIYFLLEVKHEIDRYVDMIKNEDELKRFVHNVNSWEEISDEEVNIFIQYYRTKDKHVILNYISQKISGMPDEEKVECMIDINIPWSDFEIKDVLQLINSLIRDKSKILDRGISFVGTEEGEEILNSMDYNFLAQYIKENWKRNPDLILYFIDNGNVIEILNKMNDVDKTNFIMEYLAPRSGNVRVSDYLDRVMFEIKDDFCRKVLITFIKTDAVIDVAKFQEFILQYQKISEQVEQISDEEEKTDFIIGLQDNDLKIQFLKQIESRVNRDKIIQSLDRYIDPRIESQVQLVREMIIEFFEDNMGDSLTEEQKEKLYIALEKTSVEFSDLKGQTNGIAHNLYDSIEISTRHLNNPSKTILFLLHEYGHIFSQQDLKKYNYMPNRDIEEGMQDLFSELVTNHYLEKHGQINLNGRKVGMEYPCKSYSSYHYENSWTRTILYPLEKQGKDIEAVTEYLLGDKNKFLEMTLGKENADSKPSDLFGNKMINVSLSEIYPRMPEGFENDNITDSIYGRRNNFLPIFKLQKMLDGTGIDFFGLKGEERYYCTCIADKYFNGRKLYQISREEMAKFHDLYDAQKEIAITNYDEFANKMINELSEHEVTQYSAEILDSSLALLRDVGQIGRNLEKVWSFALEEERQKIERGQSVSETASKYKKIINEYMTLLSRINGDESEYLMDGVKDLKEAYLQQMEECIRSGNVQEVLEGLRNNDDGTLYVDSDILKLFESLGVKFQQVQMMGTCYTAQDIVDSAIRGKLKLDDVKRVSVILESDKTNVMGERTND